MHAARLVVGGSGIAAALFHAGLAAMAGRPAWPVVLGVAIGLGCRAVWGPSTAVTVALAAAPAWPIVGATFWPGGPPFESLWPWLAFLVAALAWPERRAPAAGAWALALAGWSLIVAATWPIVALRELDFTAATVTAVTVNGPSAGTPMATASFAALMSAAQIAAVLLAGWYAHASTGARGRLWWAILPGVLTASGVAVWQQLVDSAFFGSEPWTSLRRSPGTFYDANATGAFLALAAPALAVHLTAPARLPSWLLTTLRTAALGLALAGVLASGSRTSLAALGVALVALVVTSKRRAGWIGLAVAVVVLAVLAQRPPSELGRGQAAGRLAGTLTRLLQSGPAGVWTLLRDRDGYGPAARAMIADHPWFGVGTGTFSTIVSSYGATALGAPLPGDNAQNWWRHTAAELGVFGAVPAFAASLLLGLAAARLFRRRDAAAAAAPIAGLALMALVSPPTAHPILQVLVGLIAGAVVAASAEPPAGPAPAVLTRMMWLLAAAGVVGTSVTSWRDLRPPYRAADFHFAYDYGTTDIVSTPFGEGRWMGTRAVAVIPPTASRTLIASVVAAHDDLATRPVAIWVSDRHRVVCRGRVSDHTPLVCRVPVPHDAWPMLKVEVERGWQTVEGVPRAAVVSARFE